MCTSSGKKATPKQVGGEVEVRVKKVTLEKKGQDKPVLCLNGMTGKRTGLDTIRALRNRGLIEDRIREKKNMSHTARAADSNDASVFSGKSA